MNSHPTKAPRTPTDQSALWILTGILATLVVVWVGGAGLAIVAGEAWAAAIAPTPESMERARLASLKPGENLDPDIVAHGKSVFTATCASCHGEDGRGVAGRGKPLTTSLFAIQMGDASLVEFVKKGRPVTDPLNTTKVDMPPRGGNPTLTDADMSNVVAYVRVIQRPERVSFSALAAAEERVRVAEAKAEAEQAALRAAKKAEKAAQLATKTAAGSPPAGAAASGAAGASATVEEEDTETIAWGGELFLASCSSCHGKDGKGLPQNGKDLVHSTFCKELKDDQLVAFIKRGRDSGDPLNTTKIAMPPKGGNPSLNDEKIEAIVAYVRSLQKAATN